MHYIALHWIDKLSFQLRPKCSWEGGRASTGFEVPAAVGVSAFRALELHFLFLGGFLLRWGNFLQVRSGCCVAPAVLCAFWSLRAHLPGGLALEKE